MRKIKKCNTNLFMKILKQILNYLVWLLIAFIAAFIYTRIILGTKPEPSIGFLKLFDWTYNVALFQISLIIGCTIGLLYIFFDVFYLNRKLKGNKKSTFIRFLALLIITVFVGTTHYILEKVIDVI